MNIFFPEDQAYRKKVVIAYATQIMHKVQKEYGRCFHYEN